MLTPKPLPSSSSSFMSSQNVSPRLMNHTPRPRNHIRIPSSIFDALVKQRKRVLPQAAKRTFQRSAPKPLSSHSSSSQSKSFQERCRYALDQILSFRGGTIYFFSRLLVSPRIRFRIIFSTLTSLEYVYRYRQGRVDVETSFGYDLFFNVSS